MAAGSYNTILLYLLLLLLLLRSRFKQLYNVNKIDSFLNETLTISQAEFQVYEINLMFLLAF